MDSHNFESASSLIGTFYSGQAISSHNSFSSLVSQLLTQRRIPSNPWPENLIEHFLYELSLMDSNNYLERSGVGEREGRVCSSIISKRHYYLSHGIGRSGDLFSLQPKAAGSSLILKLTCAMAKQAMKISGMGKLNCVVVPLATGMSISMCLLSLKIKRPAAKFVIWSRIDQKTCLKCISTVGLIPIVLETVLDADSVTTGNLEKVIGSVNIEEVLCVLSTTSCFAPRSPDDVELISRICKEVGIPHIINNAYGLQCSKITHKIREAIRIGRVDFIVQSTDKNFLVPVGGAIIASPDPTLLNDISELYPGRASISPILDLFIAFLSLGESGYKNLLDHRKALIPEFQARLSAIAEKYGERMLNIRNNTISFAISCKDKELGSKLFLRRVSGCRCVGSNEKEVCGIKFRSYGSSFEGYPSMYITAACAIGLTREEMQLFFDRLEGVLQR